MDPLGLIDDLATATDRLLDSVRALNDDDIAAPSRLPGWTRGHVLAHLARNADSAINLLTWARTGVPTPQYASREARAADIDAGAGRDAATQLDDVTVSARRLAAAAAELPAAAWSVQVQWISGLRAPAARIVWSRLREVEIHHVDLGVDYSATRWPEAFTLRLLRAVAKEFGDRSDGPRLVLRTPEVGHDLAIGDDVTEPVLLGPAWAAAAWLIGRDCGAQLTALPTGPLPHIPTWG